MCGCTPKSAMRVQQSGGYRAEPRLEYPSFSHFLIESGFRFRPALKAGFACAVDILFVAPRSIVENKIAAVTHGLSVQDGQCGLGKRDVVRAMGSFCGRSAGEFALSTSDQRNPPISSCLCPVRISKRTIRP